MFGRPQNSVSEVISHRNNTCDLAIVVTVTVIVAAVPPLTETMAGETLQVAATGAPPQLNITFH
jgi:hypothetical protein